MLYKILLSSAGAPPPSSKCYHRSQYAKFSIKSNCQCRLLSEFHSRDIIIISHYLSPCQLHNISPFLLHLVVLSIIERTDFRLFNLTQPSDVVAWHECQSSGRVQRSAIQRRHERMGYLALQRGPWLTI